jgi:PrcB C-terminal
MIATVGDASTLRNYWVDILGQQTPLPQVDYFKDRVVIVFVGKRNTNGYSLNVTDVRGMPGGRTIVYLDEATPYPGMITTQAQTSPWALITVARENVSLEMSVRHHRRFMGVDLGAGCRVGNSIAVAMAAIGKTPADSFLTTVRSLVRGQASIKFPSTEGLVTSTITNPYSQ